MTNAPDAAIRSAMDFVNEEMMKLEQLIRGDSYPNSPRVRVRKRSVNSLRDLWIDLDRARVEARRLHGVTWVLIADGRVLLERCPKKAQVLGVGEWFVPGGKIEEGEAPEDALRREIAEEWPGVTLVSFQPLPIVEGSAVPPGPRGLFLMRPFVVWVNGDTPEQSADGVQLGWFPIEEALESPVPQVRMMVAAAVGSATPAQRVREDFHKERP